MVNQLECTQHWTICTTLRRRRMSIRIKVCHQIFSPNLKTTMQLMVMRVKVQVTEHDLLIELVYSV